MPPVVEKRNWFNVRDSSEYGRRIFNRIVGRFYIITKEKKKKFSHIIQMINAEQQIAFCKDVLALHQ